MHVYTLLILYVMSHAHAMLSDFYYNFSSQNRILVVRMLAIFMETRLFYKYNKILFQNLN